MNRIDRLFAILLLLQRKRRVRAIDLARTFEVSERTIYRDMTALNESGVPIIALPGLGYELMDGYYLPPVRFSGDEAAALVLGMSMLQAHTRGRIEANADGRWVDTVYWRTLAEAHHAAEAVMGLPSAQAMFALIDHSTITMLHGEPMQSYG